MQPEASTILEPMLSNAFYKMVSEFPLDQVSLLALLALLASSKSHASLEKKCTA